MAVLLKTALVRVSSIQIMQVRVQNKGKSVWTSRYDGDVSSYYVHPTLNHVSLSLDVNECEEIDKYSRHATWTYVPKVILLCS